MTMENHSEMTNKNTQTSTTLAGGSSNNDLSGIGPNAEKKVKRTSALFIIFWLLIFAPVGLYLLWKEKRLHIWFPNLLIVFGLFNVLPVFTMIFFVFPKMIRLYDEIGASYNKNTVIISATAILFISLLEIVTGFILRKKVKEEGFLKNLYVVI
ncbi:hypothetical protein L6272_03285, partial [Microgenomates group bacterium]|nr:hypothetical protein [Microgenomates group bacterium]